MDKLKFFLTVHKATVILIGILILIAIGGFSLFQKFTEKSAGPVEEVDLAFDAEGPFALLHPRRDGNALVLSLKRTASYDAISYELAYTSNTEEVAVEGGRVKRNSEDEEEFTGAIERGVAGQIETSDKKGEYEQEILFGTCSKNVCKYDKGVENGTLTLYIKKGSKTYRMITQWHLQKPDVSLGILTSGDAHLSYTIDAERQTLANIGFTIINDLTGVPKLPLGKEVLGKVYSLNPPIAKDIPAGDVSLELAETPPSDARLYRYKSSSEWEELETRIEGSKLSAKVGGAGIFAVLTTTK